MRPLGFFAKVDPKFFQHNQAATSLRTITSACTSVSTSQDAKAARAVAASTTSTPKIAGASCSPPPSARLDELEGKGAGVADEKDRLRSFRASWPPADPGLDIHRRGPQDKGEFPEYRRTCASAITRWTWNCCSPRTVRQQLSAQFTFVHPQPATWSSCLRNKKTIEMDLPKDFNNSNVVIEITSMGGPPGGRSTSPIR